MSMIYLILPALLAAGAVGYVIWTRKKARTDAEVAEGLAILDAALDIADQHATG